MNIETFYKHKIILHSKNNISKYLDRFKNKLVTVYYDKDTYLRYKDILKLDSLNIYKLIDIDKINIDISTVNQNTNILILVKHFSNPSNHYMHIYKYLYDNDIYKNNIYADLLIDMDILIDDTFTLLWNNITKLESKLEIKDCTAIIQKKYNSYIELFEAMLIKTNLIDDYSLALIHQEIYTDTFGNLSKNIKNLIVFCASMDSRNNFFYGSKYLRFFNFIDLFIGTSIIQLPKNSKYISINHGVIDDPGGFVDDNKYTDQKEYYFYVRKTLQNTNINIISCDLIKISNYISLGYPKLDKFIKFYNENKNKNKKSIVIAVSSRRFNFKNINPIVQDKEFIDDVLSKFNDYKVIFRPHPNEMESEYIQQYTDNLKRFNNFKFDTEKSYLDNFTNAKVFISDGLGSSAYTYTFATLKPVIFYIPKLDKYLKDYGDSYYAKYLNLVGDVVTDRVSLINMISKYLSDDNFIQSKSLEIKKLRNKNIFNIGSSEEKITFFINRYILIDKSNKIKKYYIDKFKEKSKKRIANYFDKFKNKKIAIYGAGEHFELILMKIYDFNKLNIICFSDSNNSIIGNTKYNCPIVHKDSLHDADIILISSKKYEKEIKKDLTLHYTNIYTVYEVLNTEIALYMNLSTDITLRNLWLNIQLIEQMLSLNDIDMILDANYAEYNDLLKDCKSLLLNKYNEEIYYSDNLKDIYLGDKFYLFYSK